MNVSVRLPIYALRKQRSNETIAAKRGGKVEENPASRCIDM